MSIITPDVLFREFNGSVQSGFAAIDAPVHHSPGGVLYLVKPGIVLLSRPTINLGGLAGFLSGFDESLNFPEYLEDPTTLPDGAQLCKIAGQVCYMSFGRGRTFNAQADRYFNNLKSSGHGSVFEHANFSFLLYGISRSVTHELIRHRAGFGYCLTGDTLIYSTHQVRGKPDGVTKRRLDELYVMTQTPHGRSRIKLLRLRCLDETTNTFVAGRVKRIVCSGLKPVFTVKLADGKTITTTKEHHFLTKDGWMTLEDAVGGLEITANGTVAYGKQNVELMVNGRPIYQDAEWLSEQYLTKGLSQAAIAELSDASPHTIRTWVRKYGLQRPTGSWTVGKTPWNKGLHLRKPRLIPKPVRIVSISYASEQMTYDIEMEEPHHNFIANGIITHNSQLSQRFVSGRMLRFVERPEYQHDELFHTQFLERIERAAAEYTALTNRLLEMQQAGTKILSAEAKTDLRKKVQQCARSVLPNETEAPIVVTGNARAWRHFTEMRASAHAEVEIRELAVRIFLCLYLTDPVLFSDYTVEQLPDGTYTAKTEFEKV